MVSTNLKSEKKLVLILLCSLAFNVGVIAQVPQYIKRYSEPAKEAHLRDSVVNSIVLNPGFQWIARPDITYLGVAVKPAINIEWPKERQVIQRANDNKAWLYVKGSCDLDIDSVKITATSIIGGITKSKNFKANGGTFEGAIQLTGGEYQFTAKELYSNGAYVNVISARSSYLGRVGVGEVLLAWGHSFMTGNIGTNSTDLRSRTIPAVYENPDYPNNNFFQNIPELPMEFKSMDEDEVGPFGLKSWILSGLADTLVNRLQVPVLIYSSAFGGSNIYQNYKNIRNEPFGYTWFGDGVWQNNGFPFKTVEATFGRYVPVTGLRGVITAHGVNDHTGENNEPVDFTTNFNYVINHIRTVTANNASNLAFMLGMEDGNFSAINNQLVNIINNDPNIYMGIDLRDPATYGTWRDDSYGANRGHFIGQQGLEKYLGLWANAIQNSFFTNTTPIIPVVNPALMN
jgi:hypothetical protein